MRNLVPLTIIQRVRDSILLLRRVTLVELLINLELGENILLLLYEP